MKYFFPGYRAKVFISFANLNLLYFVSLAPSQVRNLVPKETTPLKICLQWDQPENPNGNVYYIVCQMIDSRQISKGDIRNQYYCVEDLNPFTTYTFLIKACTRKGCSKAQELNVTTNATGMKIYVYFLT